MGKADVTSYIPEEFRGGHAVVCSNCAKEFSITCPVCGSEWSVDLTDLLELGFPENYQQHETGGNVDDADVFDEDVPL